MTAHEAAAHRTAGTPSPWSVWCPTCRTRLPANGKQQADQLAAEHNALRLLESWAVHDCYDSGALEYDPHGPDYCRKCVAQLALGMKAPA